MAEIIRPIYIEKEEGVGSIISRAQNTSDDKLALVFPPDSLVFKNVLEIEFLKRELDKLGKNAVIITSDPSQAELAKGLGFQSGEDLKQQEQTDKFLEDFYRPDGISEDKKERKITSPLVKPMSDIISDEKKIKVSTESNKVPRQMTDIGQENKGRQDVSDNDVDQEAKIEREEPKSPRVEPISLTEEDLDDQNQEETKKTKETRIKLSSLGKLFKRKSKKTANEESPFKEVTAKKHDSGSLFKKIFVVLLLAAIGLLVVSATFVFPKANILISPAREKAQLNIDIALDANEKAVNFEKNTIPGQIFKMTKSKSKEFSATKEEDIRNKAEGVITIYNAYSSEPQTLVATTRFEAPDGKIFRITKTITVPGAKIVGGTIEPSTIDAEVVADQPGEDYNLGPTNFTIPGFKGTDKYSGFYGKSAQPMTGGLIKRGLVVGQEDVNRAEAELKDALLKEAEEELKKQLSEDFKLIESSISAEIAQVKAVPEVGKPADKFTLTLEALAQAFAYKEQDLGDLVEEKIALKISDKRLTLPSTRKINFTKQALDFAAGIGEFNLLVEEDVSWKIDEQRLSGILAGKNQEEAKEAIKLFPEVNSAEVKLWPFWLRHIPKDSRKIRLTIDYEASLP